MMDVEDVAEVFGDAIREAIEPLRKRIDRLEERGVKYVGTWQKAADYARGDVVTDQGSMWVCLKDGQTGSRPSNAPDAWQLSAKAKS